MQDFKNPKSSYMYMRTTEKKILEKFENFLLLFVG